jgi:hypothetical protein
MLSLRRLIGSFFCAAAVVCGPVAPAGAVAIYSYAGPDFTNVTGPYTTAMSLNGTITLSTPIGLNATNFDATTTLVSMAFFDGVNPYTDVTPDDPTSLALFTTDGTGAITNWAFDFRDSVDGQVITCRMGGGISLPGGVGFYECLLAVGGPDGLSAGRNNVDGGGAWEAGTWTLIPEPGTAPLAGMGLLAFSGYAAHRRVRRRSTRA